MNVPERKLVNFKMNLLLHLFLTRSPVFRSNTLTTEIRSVLSVKGEDSLRQPHPVLADPGSALWRRFLLYTGTHTLTHRFSFYSGLLLTFDLSQDTVLTLEALTEYSRTVTRAALNQDINIRYRAKESLGRVQLSQSRPVATPIQVRQRQLWDSETGPTETGSTDRDRSNTCG